MVSVVHWYLLSLGLWYSASLVDWYLMSVVDWYLTSLVDWYLRTLPSSQGDGYFASLQLGDSCTCFFSDASLLDKVEHRFRNNVLYIPYASIAFMPAV